MSDVVKHLPGQHDQSEHGVWAREAAARRAEDQKAAEEREEAARREAAQAEELRKAANNAELIGRVGPEAARRRNFAEDPDVEEFDGKPTSRSTFADEQKDGSWKYDEDRVRLHEDYYSQELAKGTPVDSPTVVFLGGGPASGKSTVMKGLDIADNKVVSNADEAKSTLPEYQDGLVSQDKGIAAFVHEESSMMGKELNRRALEQSKNLVIDGTGDGIKKMPEKVQAMRDAVPGIRVDGDYVTIPVADAWVRSVDRAEDKESPSFGRHVPEKTLRRLHEGVSETFPTLLPQQDKPAVFDRLRLWDNSVPQGSPPRLIVESSGGRTTVYDEQAYWDFLAKSPVYAGREQEWFLGPTGVPLPLIKKGARIIYDLTKAAGEEGGMDSDDIARLLRAILNDRTWDEFIAVAPSFDTPEYREAWDEFAADVKAMEESGMFPDVPQSSVGL